MWRLHRRNGAAVQAAGVDSLQAHTGRDEGRRRDVQRATGLNTRVSERGRSAQRIHTEEACAAAHGLWILVVFGWMTHVYPDEKDTWAGMDMEVPD